jgi:hypothetical protein
LRNHSSASMSVGTIACSPLGPSSWTSSKMTRRRPHLVDPVPPRQTRTRAGTQTCARRPDECAHVIVRSRNRGPGTPRDATTSRPSDTAKPGAAMCQNLRRQRRPDGSRSGAGPGRACSKEDR